MSDPNMPRRDWEAEQDAEALHQYREANESDDLDPDDLDPDTGTEIMSDAFGVFSEPAITPAGEITGSDTRTSQPFPYAADDPTPTTLSGRIHDAILQYIEAHHKPVSRAVMLQQVRRHLTCGMAEIVGEFDAMLVVNELYLDKDLVSKT